ncbi:hypothetical protein TGAMA5MH_03075 [Trichoderma gamsii]|uniref:Uncharacterized protein n=1 Tax=Trichoderma gamsii TaxID=398673 RepID=A0A2K0TIJ0_9HYPO|nr:hypothetical protein TGAMA5MH_03075 [Trichoderma gamsii]
MDTLRLHQSRCNPFQRRGVPNRSETPDTIFQHYCRRYSCRRAAATSVEIAGVRLAVSDQSPECPA